MSNQNNPFGGDAFKRDFRFLVDRYKESNHQFANDDQEAIWWLCLDLLGDAELMVSLAKSFHGQTTEFFEQVRDVGFELKPENCDHKNLWQDCWNETEADTVDELYQVCMGCGLRRQYPYVHWTYMLEGDE